MEVANSETFHTDFHNLPGFSEDDKRRNLFILLKRSTGIDLEASIISIEPQNYLETILKVDAMVQSKMLMALTEVLKSGETVLVAKIIKSKWFCKEFARLLDNNPSGATEFVETLLPFMSYVLRMRLIQRLAKYGNNLDSVFDLIRDRYGQHISAQLLVACSDTRVHEVLSSNKNIVLSAPQLRRLCDRSFQLFLLYKNNNSNDISGALHHAGCRNLEFLHEILPSSHFNVKLGKRLTKKFVMKYKQAVITSPKFFFMMLHFRALKKLLTESEMKSMYFNTFPETIAQITYCSSLCDTLGNSFKSTKYALLSEGINKVYNKSIYDYPDLVSDDMIEQMESSERLKWLKIKDAKVDNSKYLEIAASIPSIKKAINVTSSQASRGTLLVDLIETCKINNNLEALADVLSYINTRHRNDDSHNLYQVLRAISDNFMELPQKHWTMVMSLVEINKEYEQYHLDLRLKHLEHVFLNNGNKITDQRIYQLFNTYKIPFNFLDQAPNNEVLLTYLLEKLLNWQLPQDDKDRVVQFNIQLLGLIDKFNTKYPTNKQFKKRKDLLLNYPRLLEFLRSYINKVKTSTETRVRPVPSSFLIPLVCSKEKSPLRDEFTQLYCTVAVDDDYEILLWLSRYNPEAVLINLDNILKKWHSFFRFGVEICQNLKKYDLIASKIVSYSSDVDYKNDDISKISFKFATAAVLLPESQFLELLVDCPPSILNKNFIEGACDDDLKKRQSYFASAASWCKHTKTYKIVPALVQYCEPGDLLRYSMNSLSYLLYYSPENQVANSLRDLSTKAVSVRKHSFLLQCVIGNYKDTLCLLQKFCQSEKNISVNKRLWEITYRYFLRNPTKDIWDILKVVTTKLDYTNDKESIQLLLSYIKQNPQSQCVDYGDYVDYLYYIWKMLSESTKKFAFFQRTFLDSIPDDVLPHLSLDFIMSVIRENFMKKDGIDLRDFIFKIITKTSNRDDVLRAIFGILSDVKAANNDFKSIECGSTKNCVSIFLNHFVSRCQTDELHNDLLIQFSDLWNSTFSEIDMTEEYLKLQFTVLFFKSFYKSNIPLLCEKISGFFQCFVNKYGILLTDIFARVLKEQLRNMCYQHNGFDINKSEETFMQVCFELLNKKNFHLNVLVCKMLPCEISNEEDVGKTNQRALFLKIMEILMTQPEPTVQILMNEYIKNLKIE